MGKKASSIRKGFEYQDLVCATQLLNLVEHGQFSTTFTIESDEVNFVDDLIIFPPRGPVKAFQVKSHVVRSYVDSYDTLVEKKTPNSRSLLKKLYEGWKQLCDTTGRSVEIEFISSGQTDTASGGLADAISSSNDTIDPSFFSESRFALGRAKWLRELGITQPQLEHFLKCVCWRFGYSAHSRMQSDVIDRLRRLALPSHGAAIAELLSLVANLATTQSSRTTIADFLKLLWNTSSFREACEERFTNIDFGFAATARATQLRVAIVDLVSIPAYSNTNFACLEEPCPLSHYASGLSAPTLAGLFDDQRELLKTEYLKWQLNRVMAVLDRVAEMNPHLIVFPRFSIPFDTALSIFAWAEERECSVYIGGHALEPADGGIDSLRNFLNVRQEAHFEADCLPVADILLRSRRGGRSQFADVPSPYSATERLLSGPVTVPIHAEGGWLTLLFLPSAEALQQCKDSNIVPPEFLLCVASGSSERLRSELTLYEPFHRIPVGFSTLNSGHRGDFTINDSAAEYPHAVGPWEGLQFATIYYERGAENVWSARIDVVTRLPIVYHDDGIPHTSGDRRKWISTLRGTSAAVELATYEMGQSESTPVDQVAIVLNGEDPDSFFVRRLQDTEVEIRDRLFELPPRQITSANAALTEIEIRSRDYSSHLVRQYENRPTPIDVARRSEPSLVDRTEETRKVSRVSGGSSHYRVCHIHGQLGIGKRAIIRQAHATAHNRDKWLFVRCIPDSSFAEFLGLLLLELGDTIGAPPVLAASVYQWVCKRIVDSSYAVLVLEDAENLPLAVGDAGHGDFLGFISEVCKLPLGSEIRLVLTSTRRGDLQGFAESHLYQPVQIGGLSTPDELRLLQELIAFAGRVDPPVLDDLERLAEQLHGHPGLAALAVSLLESVPCAELAADLHNRPEVRDYITSQIIGRLTLQPLATSVLDFAAIFRIPVDKAAFAAVAGAQSRQIVNSLIDRMFLLETDDLLTIHPLIRGHWRSIERHSEQDERRLHKVAFDYFDEAKGHRRLTLDEAVERVFHGLRAGVHIDLREYNLFFGPARTAMISALKEHDFDLMSHISELILGVVHDDAVATLVKGVADDAKSEPAETSSFGPALNAIDEEHLWIAVELARSRIRRRDRDSAEAILETLQERFGQKARILVAYAQLDERRGHYDDAISACDAVLDDRNAYTGDVLSAFGVLKRARRYERLIEFVESAQSRVVNDERIRRIYAYSCVVSGHAPLEGIQILERQWSERSWDGQVIADFGGAMWRTGSNDRAEDIFKKGLRDVGFRTKQRTPILEEYALYLHESGRLSEANQRYEELYNLLPYEIYVARRFAKSLCDEGNEAVAQSDIDRAAACFTHAEQILIAITENAPADEWAQTTLELVRKRDTSSIAQLQF